MRGPVDIESLRPPTSIHSAIRDRFSTLFFDLRTSFGREPDLIPIQPPPNTMHELWPPYFHEKRPRTILDTGGTSEQEELSRKPWLLRNLGTIILALVLIFLCLNIIFLDVRTLSRPTSPPPPTLNMSSNSPMNAPPQLLSSETLNCISQFNASTDPSFYTCSPCLADLQTIPPGLLSVLPNAQEAIQFCGLKSLYEATSPEGRQALRDGGWLQDIKVCTWKGVACNSAGRISYLELADPSVPSSIPSELGVLNSLETLRIVGNTKTPAGPFPPSMKNLSTLTSLHLQSTSLPSLPTDILASLSSLRSLSLAGNPHMSPEWPESLSAMPLQNLAIVGQNLTDPLLHIVSSPSKMLRMSLKTIDLSSTSLSGPIPPLAPLTSLISLRLASNDLYFPESWPGACSLALPAGLTSLTLRGNAKVAGVPVEVCNGILRLDVCDLRETRVMNECGVCMFG